MRVAVVHSFYTSDSPSGENAAVEQQIRALQHAGHDVELFARHTDELRQSATYGLAAAGRVATGWGASPLRELSLFEPDVVHIHNLFPNFGRKWVQKRPWPTVATLHNYRPLCAAGTFFRDSGTCTLCLDARRAAPAVVHKCYRDSRVATVPLALGMRFDRDPVLESADRLIVLTETMADMYARVGLDRARMTIVPNFVEVSSVSGRSESVTRPYFAFVGRLSHEKGILQLLRAWPRGHRLVVVGDGPLAAEVGAFASDEIEVRGPQARGRALEVIAHATGLIFPSLWLEGFPLVYLEAISAGTPVLATGSSVVRDLVASDGTGSAVAASDLEQALARAARDFPMLRSHCRQVFETTYSADAWLERTNAVYEAARAEHASTR